MDLPDIHVDELKQDKEFLANIERLEKECKEEESLTKGYQLLDAKLIIEAPEDDINEIFSFIVNRAFDILADKLVSSQKFDMSDSENLNCARAIYEHGIQKYSENDKTGAKEIFLILYYTIDNEILKESMMVHAVSVMSDISFEKFIEDMVDSEKIDENDPFVFFIQNFTKKREDLLKDMDKYVKKAIKELEAFENSK